VKLFEPHRSIADPEARRQSRLLGISMVVLTGLFVVVDTTLTITSAGYKPPWFGYALLCTTIVLNRLGRYQVASAIAMAMFPLVVFGLVFGGLGRLPLLSLNYLVLAPMLGAIFLPIWGVGLITAANLGLIALAPWFAPGMNGDFEQIIGPLSTNAMVGALAALYMHHRNAVEADRRRTARETEERARQAQKMEALGRLSGGVAHDFNNALTVILASVALLRRRPSAEQLDEIDFAANSAAALTRQLLAFSRGAALEPRLLNLDDAVEHTLALIRRLIGEDIEVRYQATAEPWQTRIDPNQLQQILLNLATNARDAMPHGGTLALSVDNLKLDAQRLEAEADARSGEYVRLRVQDTGGGMDESTRQHIFEPFFTTKARGKGTGLGLATVFGTVSQSGGFIEVQSAPGEGAQFDLYFPRAQGSARALPPAGHKAAAGRETLLLVEDDDAVRKVVALMLEEAGYRVLAASSAAHARELWSAHAAQIALLITDEVMPGGRGSELVVELRRARPGLRALCMTGYADSAASGAFAPDLPKLQKPFEAEALLRRVRELLDAN
jgi:signal transduction histidine kinase